MVSVLGSQRVTMLVKLHFSIYDCDKRGKAGTYKALSVFFKTCQVLCLCLQGFLDKTHR